METGHRQGRIVAAFGRKPRESTKYRLPLSIALLVSVVAVILFSEERGLDDLAFLAFGIYITCNSVGDRIWAINVKAAAWIRLAGAAAWIRLAGAAAWIRLAGAAALLAGAASIATHLYVERSWVFLAIALVLIPGAIIFWVQDLGGRIQGAPGDDRRE